MTRNLRQIVCCALLSHTIAGCSWFVGRELEDKDKRTISGDIRTQPDAGMAPTDTDDGSSPVDRDAMTSDASPDSQVPMNGLDYDGGMDSDTKRRSLKLCVGAEHACVVLPSKELRCWGRNLEGQRDLPTRVKYQDIACGDYHTCGLDEQGSLDCAGRNREGQRARDAGPFTQVVASSTHTCALNGNGKVSCWGLDDHGQLHPPDEAFLVISAGEGFGCGIRARDSEVTCWGNTTLNLGAAPAGTKFTAIDSADSQTCAVTDTGAVACWGHSHESVPPMLFGATRVSTARIGSCASLAGDKVRCWDGRQPSLPTEVLRDYVQAELGRTSWCLVPAEGPIVCDSSQPEGIYAVPSNLLETW